MDGRSIHGQDGVAAHPNILGNTGMTNIDKRGVNDHLFVGGELTLYPIQGKPLFFHISHNCRYGENRWCCGVIINRHIYSVFNFVVPHVDRVVFFARGKDNGDDDGDDAGDEFHDVLLGQRIDVSVFEIGTHSVSLYD